MSRGKEVKELREKMGMNRREFSDYYGIPYRTVQDWDCLLYTSDAADE